MAEQLSFPGFAPGGRQAPKPRLAAARPPRKPLNLFFALRPAPDDALLLAALGQHLAQAHFLRCQPLAADRLHVSLHNLGEHDVLPPELVRWACHVADGLALKPFDVVFDHALVYRNKGLTYVLSGAAGLDALRHFWRELGIALVNASSPFKVKPDFSPHMTLAYKGRPGLQHPIPPVRWPAHELVLINSHQGKTVHEVVGRWPLPQA